MISAIATLLSLSLVLFTNLAHAHGDHSQTPLAADADWATRHMAEEHHISTFDAGSFFNLHDYDSSGTWEASELRKTLGFLDESTAAVSKRDKDAAVDAVLALFDRDRSGGISYAEYTIGSAHGLVIPDFGYGPGHHGDDEYEYEIHHWEKYHDENTKEEDLVHPEDIAHFRKHDRLDEEAEQQDLLDRMDVVEANIPNKFRRDRG